MSETLFTPPAPEPAPGRLSILRFLSTVRSNALGMWSREAYERWWLRDRLLNRVSLLLNGPEMIRHVLVENPGNYTRTPATIRILRPIVGQGLLLSEGEEWRHQRRTIAPALAPRMMPVLGRHVVAAAEETVARLAARGPEAPADLLTEMQFLALEIAARSMFSVEMRGRAGALRALMFRYGERHARPFLLDLFLPASIPTPQDIGRRLFHADWARFIEGIMAEREAAGPAPGGPRDLFDLLRDARDPETGAAFSAEVLRDQVATMIVAGHETTALALFWSLWLLAQVPGDQARAAEEAACADLSPEAAGAAAARLPFLRAVVSEALRLYPPAFTLARVAIRPDRAGGVHIPAGAAVFIAPWVLHRHRLLWRNPDAFDPRRFLPGADPPPRFGYLPFGAGPRVCVGAQFALTEAVLVLAAVLRAFHVELLDREPVLPVAVVTTVPNRAPRFRLVPRAAPRTDGRAAVGLHAAG